MAASAASTGAGSSAASTAASMTRVLVGEDAEDRAFGDAGGLGDLAGGHVRAVGHEQGNGGGDDRGPPLVGRQGGGPLARRVRLELWLGVGAGRGRHGGSS